MATVITQGVGSDIEEHRLALALEADVEPVDRVPAALAVAPGDEGRAALRLLDQPQYRVGGVGVCLVLEVDPGVRWTLMPRAKTATLTCGAMSPPCGPGQGRA
jgi:hypothetical protein